MDWCCSIYKTVKSEIKRCLGLQTDVATEQDIIDEQTKQKENQVSSSETRIEVSINVSNIYSMSEDDLNDYIFYCMQINKCGVVVTSKLACKLSVLHFCFL